MLIEQLYRLYLKNPSVQTDTRKLQKGDLFFALKGPNFNANTFASKAIEQGAAYAIVDEAPETPNDRIIVVDDVLKTLQDLALFHRRQFSIPVIAITGTNGKTTTKELVHAVLSTTFKTHTTQGNLNNHIGIPLTLLAMKRDTEMAIIEMGANHQKEIAGYCKYTLPTHGIITNCGKAHLEGFGSEEGVRKAKGELYDHLRETDGTAFVMWDYDYLREMSKGIKTVIKYGKKDADVTGSVKRNEPFLEMDLETDSGNISIRSQLVGAYNLPNLLCAATVGNHFNVDLEKIKAALESYHPSNSRSQLIQKNSNTIILDAYNANPSSMKLAIENFASMNVGDKVLMLGAMAELGPESMEEHKTIVDLIEKHEWKNVVLVGGDFMKLGHPFIKFVNSVEAAEWFNKQNFTNTYFLIKGSRSIQMEKVIGG
jgi:UDP-N-acetylmuramoyl-tripeptide--D-alanyl-D-alanine ligase